MGGGRGSDNDPGNARVFRFGIFDNRQISAGDVAGTFGVAALGTQGKGRFLVLGDDALFQNRFMDENNSTFAVNLAKWLVAR